MLETDSPKSNVPESQFRPEIELGVNDYCPLSPSAVIAFLGALLSLTAIISPLLWFLPVVTIVLAASAMWQVTRDDATHGGKQLSAVALIIALLVAGYAPARTFSRQQAMYAQAQVFAEAWLDLILDDHVHEAHQLALPFRERFVGSLTLDEFYADQVDPMMDRRLENSTRPEEAAMMYAMRTENNETPSAKLALFLQADVVSQLLELPDSTEVRFVDNVSQQTHRKRLYVTQRFEATYTDDGGEQKFPFSLVSTRRQGDKAGDTQWEVGETDAVPSLPSG
jgi:hypothetical protein